MFPAVPMPRARDALSRIPPKLSAQLGSFYTLRSTERQMGPPGSESPFGTANQQELQQLQTFNDGFFCTRKDLLASPTPHALFSPSTSVINTGDIKV